MDDRVGRHKHLCRLFIPSSLLLHLVRLWQLLTVIQFFFLKSLDRLKSFKMPHRITLVENEVGAGCILFLLPKDGKDLCGINCSQEPPCQRYCKGCQNACDPPSEKCHNPYCKLRKLAYGHPIVALGVKYKSETDNIPETRITFVIVRRP